MADMYMSPSNLNTDICPSNCCVDGGVELSKEKVKHTAHTTANSHLAHYRQTFIEETLVIKHSIIGVQPKALEITLNFFLTDLKVFHFVPEAVVCAVD